MILRDQNGGVVAMLQALKSGAIALRDASGAQLEAAKRAELLSRARAGDVEPLEFDARVYRQKRGEPLTPGIRSMQQFIQIRGGGMAAHARSYRGLPFLSGHDVGDVQKRAGSIADAWLDRVDGGTGDTNDDEMIIRHTFTAIAPWAVAGVLDGTIDRFSIHFAITGDVTCSVHNARIWSKCYCMPGQLAGVEGDQNRPRVFWIVENATGRETSAVNVPAVGGPATGIESLRFDAGGGKVFTGLAAADLVGLELLAELAGVKAAEFREALAAPGATVYDVPNQRPGGIPVMKLTRLAALLGITLAAGADLTEDQALAAVEGLKAERDAFRGRAETAEGDLMKAANAKRASDIDVELAAAYSVGKLIKRRDDKGTETADPQEANLRRVGDKLGAVELKAHLAAMPVRGPATTLQVENVPAPTAAGAMTAELSAAMSAAQLQCGLTPDEMAAARRDLGIGA